MNVAKHDRLEAVRDKYRERISANEAEHKRLKEKLAFVEEILNDANQLTFEQKPVEFTPRYEGWTLTKAVFDAVKRIGGNGGVTAQDISSYLLNNGYKHSNPKWFGSSAVLTLKRLAASEKILSEKVGNRRIYKVKM